MVSTHLLDRLIRDGHVVASRNQLKGQSISMPSMSAGIPMGTGVEAFPSAIGFA
ncbi:hypothetical protein BDZ97DRAFT_1826024 [Flammula alnicola]|nr:hypothetical protein BDZ97DRAFT_1826024 [Flammula alnicola]